MPENNSGGSGGEKVVRLEHTQRVPADRVDEWINANAVPGDTVVVTDPESGDETRRYILEGE